MKIFRKIRQQLAAQNNVAKYMHYAIGEIVLVVIGILIALQVNNLNDLRKQNNQKKLIIQSIVTDLRMDTAMISQTLTILKLDTTQVFGFIKRMSGNDVTLNTLIQIARFEFEPKIHVNITFNNNTLTSILSTGNLKTIDEWLQNEILELNEMHEVNISRTELNVRAYVEQVITYSRKYPLSDYGNISPKSKLATAIWEKAEFEGLGTSLNAMLSIKNVTNVYAIKQLNDIQQKTNGILLQLSALDKSSFNKTK